MHKHQQATSTGLRGDENHYTPYETKVRNNGLLSPNNQVYHHQTISNQTGSGFEVLNRDCFKVLKSKLSGNKLIFNALHDRSPVFNRYEFEEFIKNIDGSLQGKDIGDLFAILDYERKGKVYLEDVRKHFF